MNTCFGCTSDVLQGSDYSDCWKCKNHSLYDEDDEFTEIKNQIREDVIKEIRNQLYARARDKGIYESEYIAFIDCTFEQLKENINERDN